MNAVLPLSDATPSEREVVYLLKARCAGQTISLPRHFLPSLEDGHVEAIVRHSPADVEAIVLHSPASVLDHMLDMMVTVAGRTVDFTPARQQQAFFRIIKVDLTKRQNMICVRGIGDSVSAVQLQLFTTQSHSDGSVRGIFKTTKVTGVVTLDLLEIVKRVGIQQLLLDLVVWSSEKSSFLSSRTDIGVTRSQDTIAIVVWRPARQDRSWDDLVLFLGRHGSGPSAQFYYDVLRGAFIATNGEAFSVDLDDLHCMCNRQVLTSRENEFGERMYALTHGSTAWEASYELHQGTLDLVSHLDLSDIKTVSKAEALALLRWQGWSPGPKNALTFHSFDSEKRYHHCLRNGRMYFVALAMASEILERLPLVDGEVPCILHNMPNSYYHACATVTNF